MDITILQELWFFLIAVLIAVYFVLDGFDLGVGVLYPILGKNEEEKAVLRRSIGPVWDGNEVWLLTAGGALFAAFPLAYATTFSGFYLAVMLVLFGLIVRAVSLEYRAHDGSWKKLWDWCFTIGSLLPALLFGVAIGCIYEGIPMTANGDYSGIPLLGLITPFTLLCGVMGLVLCISQGISWECTKAPLDSDLYKRCVKLRPIWQLIALVTFIVLTLVALVGIQPQMHEALEVVRIVLAALVAALLIGAWIFARQGKDVLSFVVQSCALFMFIMLFACSMFPNLVVAAPDSIGVTITAMNAASSELTLAWMTGITCVGLPLVLLYHVFVYRSFRGRVNPQDLDY
jgi:cytochrome d ubiquinol oxidase subunit II